VDTTNYKTLPSSNRYGDISEAQEFEYEDEGEQEHKFYLHDDDDDDDEDNDDDDDDDEDFYYNIHKSKPKLKRKYGRTVSVAHQLEKDQLASKQRNNTSAIESLEILAAREILKAVEVLPAIETERENTLPQDLPVLLPSNTFAVPPTVGRANNTSDENSPILDQASPVGLIAKNKHSPNIAVCSSKESMGKHKVLNQSCKYV